MNRLYFLAAILFIAATAALGQQATETETPNKTAAPRNRDLREIERLEIEWNRINEVSDSEGKGRLLADDSYHVGPSGRTYTREQDIAAARVTEEQNRTSNSTLKFIIADKRIRLYKDVAVVTVSGTSIRTAPDGRKKLGNSFRAVHVWEKRNGRWLLVVDQVTRIESGPWKRSKLSGKIHRAPEPNGSAVACCGKHVSVRRERQIAGFSGIYLER